MKIIYDQLSNEFTFPLSKKDIDLLKKNNVIRPEIWGKVGLLRFGGNTKTTQEGRTVKKGSAYEIRINFVLRNFKTLLLSDNHSYLNLIKKCGGVLEKGSRCISWTLQNAKEYALFLLFHELGHIDYCETILGGRMDLKSERKEEEWCDNFAYKSLEIFHKNTIN